MCKNRPNQETVECIECGEHFNSRRTLQDHRRTKHNRPDANKIGQNIGHTVGPYFDKYQQQPASPLNINQFSHHHQLPSLPSFSPAMTVYPGVVSTQTTVINNRTVYQHPKFSGSRSIPSYNSTLCTPADNSMLSQESQLIENSYVNVVQHQDPMMPHSHHHQSAALIPQPAAVHPFPSGMNEFFPLATPTDHHPEGENFGSILRQVYESEHSEFHARAAANGSPAHPAVNPPNMHDQYVVPHHMNMQLYDLI